MLAADGVESGAELLREGLARAVRFGDLRLTDVLEELHESFAESHRWNIRSVDGSEFLADLPAPAQKVGQTTLAAARAIERVVGGIGISDQQSIELLSKQGRGRLAAVQQMGSTLET